VIELAVALSELATEVAVQAFAVHVSVLNVPVVEQLAVPPPEYPERQFTGTVCPVVPEIESAVERSELATEVAVQVLAVHVNTLKRLLVPHVAIPPPLYPALHVTVTAQPVVPVMELAAA